jgi:hypothetical protein
MFIIPATLHRWLIKAGETQAEVTREKPNVPDTKVLPILLF